MQLGNKKILVCPKYLFFCSMAQTKKGAIKLSANHFGLSVDSYLDKIKTENYCNKCKSWKPKNSFCIDNSRATGLHKNCNDCRWVNGGKKKGFVKGGISLFKGKKHTPKARKQMSEKRKIGGKLKLLTTIRNSPEYKIWRMRIFERDDFKCIKCNKHKSELKRKHLQADHIKPLFLIVKENELVTMNDAISCKELWELKNGRTLCMECHKQTDSFGSKSIKNYG